MFLFLQGAKLVGKSTLLRNALLPHEAHVAGMMVQRLFERGEICGFRACAVGGALPPLEREYAPGLDGVFLYRGKMAPELLAQTIAKAQALSESAACKYIILDEVGGMELLSGEFMEHLRAILALGKPCLGVLKSRENLVSTARNLALPGGVLTRRDALENQIGQSGAVLTVTRQNRAEVEAQVLRFVAAVPASQQNHRYGTKAF